MDDDVVRCAVGQRLRLRRRRLGLTQMEVGARCGVTFQQIQKYETGAATVSVSRLLMLAAALGTSVEDLVRGLQHHVGN